jgi:hypothetical protein
MQDREELRQKFIIGVEKQLVVRGGKIKFSGWGGGNKYSFRTKILTPDSTSLRCRVS